jgi:hypothetical protein
VLRRPALARARAPSLAQQALQGRPADADALAFGEQVREVTVVEPGVLVRGELEDAVLHRRGQSARRDAAPVAVDEGGRSLAGQACPQPADAALGEAEELGRLGRRELAARQSRQHEGSALLGMTHRDHLLHLWRLTKSLSS